MSGLGFQDNFEGINDGFMHVEFGSMIIWFMVYYNDRIKYGLRMGGGR